MSTLQANASPSKRLFLEMFVRDLSLEDCILDLVDNSIDSLVRSRNIKVSDALLPAEGVGRNGGGGRLAIIDVRYEPGKFRIWDNCGGISVKDAMEEVFRFGHSDNAVLGQLGVYGIGLKRAIFKIGKDITIESKTSVEGFSVHIAVEEWAKQESWTVPLTVTAGTGNVENAGTSITVKSFREEVAARLRSGTFEGHLSEMIARTYSLFLNRYVAVVLNGRKIQPKLVNFGFSKDVNVGKEELTEGNVKVTIYAGLAARREGEWQAAEAGWYVACNGRLVVAEDKTELTGWGMGMPLFVPKYRGFVGLVFFYSPNPLELPWTTTKRGLNQESFVFQRVKTRMAAIGRPVLSFLNEMYSSEEKERGPQRGVAEGVEALDVREMASRPQAPFRISAIPVGGDIVRVQYDAKWDELERVRKSLRKSRMPASKVGRYAFDYYLRKECPQ